MSAHCHSETVENETVEGEAVEGETVEDGAFDTRAIAKRRSAAGHPDRVLSLVDHSADVAAVAEALLALPTVARRLARLGGRDELTVTDRQRLCVLVALHDLGKVNHGFQNRILGRIIGRKGPSAGHVAPLAALLWGDPSAGEVEQKRRRTALMDAIRGPALHAWCGDVDDDDNGALGLLLRAVLAHHGSAPAPGAFLSPELWDDADGRSPGPKAGGLSPIKEAARLGAAVAAWFPLAFADGGHPGGQPLPTSARFLHAFAGLVVLADWLGSDESRFLLAGDPGAPPAGQDRMPFAREVAARMLRERHLDPAGRRAAARTLTLAFSPLFEGKAARPAQDSILTVPLPEHDGPKHDGPKHDGTGRDGPAHDDTTQDATTAGASPAGQVMILEAETGSGKTEAALLHFLRLLREDRVDGLYFALPTRTSAQQIQARLERDLKRILGAEAPPVGLAVPGYVRVDDRDGQPLPDFRVQWPDDPKDIWRDRGWAAEQPRRYLAGPVMVGTIDQLLLGALRVRHSHFRAGAMLRQLLVIDEVHATDPYMEALLRVILDQHRAAGGYALLMSATLGTAARNRLLTGLGRPRPVSPDAVVAPYPALHFANGVPAGGGRTKAPTPAITLAISAPEV